MKTPAWFNDLFPTPHGAVRTANSGDEMRLSAFLTPNAPNIAELQSGEWFLICPLGEHPAPDRSYTQVFTREQADAVVSTWNSIPGRAARWFKNQWHRLKSTANGAPGWDGHPETDKNRWPVERLLCEVTDLRVTDSGLEGQITWNDRGCERRTKGPLYPSPIFWHLPPNEERKVFPVLLESIGLVPTPNIASVPAWTQNASPEQAQSHDPMNEQQLAALRVALSLPADADPQKVIDTARSAFQLSTSNATALQTANTAKQTLETDLSTANGKVTTLTTEVDTLRKGLLDLAEKKGVITPAERADFQTRISTANTATAAITELQTRKPAMPTKTIELNGNRVDLSTANARQTALDAAIVKRMADDKCDRGEAYDRVMADPNYKQLIEAMKPVAPAAAAA